GLEDEHRVGGQTLDTRVIEGVLGPVESPGQPFLEGDVRPRRLEVEEPLRVDVCEATGLPDLRQVAAGERRALAAVVPAAERGDENRPLQGRPARYTKLVGHGFRLRSPGRQSGRGNPKAVSQRRKPPPNFPRATAAE